MKIFILILLFAAFTFGQSIQDRVNTFERPKSYEVSYDKFRKETTVTADCLIKSVNKKYSYNSVMSAFARIGDNGTADFAFYFPPTAHVLYDNATLQFLLDGDLVTVQSHDIDYSVIFTISLEQMNKIVNSKSVEFQLFIFEGKFDADTLTRLNNLYSLTKPLPNRLPSP